MQAAFTSTVNMNADGPMNPTAAMEMEMGMHAICSAPENGEMHTAYRADTYLINITPARLPPAARASPYGSLRAALRVSFWFEFATRPSPRGPAGGARALPLCGILAHATPPSPHPYPLSRSPAPSTAPTVPSRPASPGPPRPPPTSTGTGSKNTRHRDPRWAPAPPLALQSCWRRASLCASSLTPRHLILTLRPDYPPSTTPCTCSSHRPVPPPLWPPTNAPTPRNAAPGFDSSIDN
ncbi:hypothetical protein MSAN_00080400 [Mycena sanguinolenta]|uniref:Uncharacterized protein n=1 Tax=Mycena sanguinolenta TaxID=230812 RepID=A0A8H6ZGU9_9AGAR|nr:hypothetical protein MSAN_00080400 [Mycena sanguinolenta]